MSIWDQFTKTAHKSDGDGDWPLIEPDIYDGEIIEVSEPVDEPNRFKPGEMQTRFYVTWRLDDQETKEEVGTLRQYFNLPAAYLEHGTLSEKSGLYIFMSSMGLIEDEDAIEVNPPGWLGLVGRVTTERYETQDGRERDKVTKVMPPRKKRGAAPVAAASKGRNLNARLNGDDEDDDED